jgi:hypothetical protein
VAFFFGLLLHSVVPSLIVAVYSPSTNFRKFWIGFDFYPPSLIIRQVPVEFVHLQASQIIKVLFKVIQRMEMTAYINHISAPSKARFIKNLNAWQIEFHFSNGF